MARKEELLKVLDLKRWRADLVGGSGITADMYIGDATSSADSRCRVLLWICD